ncbi:MAG TPA: hypothetical protein VMA37_05520 [Acetobacteraceae bacterium]|nr:hypothetical protein [Acetobacteraceae bacterium]
MSGVRGVIGLGAWCMPRFLGRVSPLLVLLLGLCLSCATARAGEFGANDQIVLAALAGVQPLPVGEMAKESARGLGDANQAGVNIPLTEPSVRLWDDFGAFSPPSIGNTVVTIGTGSSGQ